jgi:hypothetical protein
MAALCGLLFNVMGYMHEELKRHPEVDFDGDQPTPEMKKRQDALKGMDDPDMKYPQEDEKTFCGNDEVAENCEGCNVGTSECKFSGKGFTPEMKGPSLIEAKELVEQILFPEEDYTWSTTIGVTDPPEPVKTVDLTGYCEGEFGDFCEAMCGWVDQCKDMIMGKNGTESIPALPDDEPEKEFNKAGCNGCINRLKSFSIYPCVVCVRNSVGTSDGHDYYHDGDW